MLVISFVVFRANGQAQTSQAFDKVIGQKMNLKYLKARKDSFIMKIANKKVGSWQWETKPNGKLLEFIDVSVLDGQVREDAYMMVDLETLEMTQMNMTMKFAGGHAKGEVKASKNRLWANYTLKRGEKQRQKKVDTLLKNWVARPVIFGLIPFVKLVSGHKKTFNAFSLSSGRFGTMTLEVQEGTKVTVPAGTFDTWKVALTAKDKGGLSNIIYIKKGFPQRIVKVDVVGSKMTIELVE